MAAVDFRDPMLVWVFPRGDRSYSVFTLTLSLNLFNIGERRPHFAESQKCICGQELPMYQASAQA